MSYKLDSIARNRRAGGTGNFSTDSAARENRMRLNERRYGESQTSADTRRSAGRTKVSHFVPFKVREAGWRKEGYRGKDAKRMASFQSSTSGQAMNMGGTLNPYGNRGKQEDDTLMPDPMPTRSAAVPQLVASEKPSFFDPILNKGKELLMGAGRKLLGGVLPDVSSPQANFMKRSASGTPLSADEISGAQAHASSMGTTFDPKTGYDRSGFLNKEPQATRLPYPKIDRSEAIAAGASRMEGYRASPSLSPTAQAAMNPQGVPSIARTRGISYDASATKKSRMPLTTASSPVIPVEPTTSSPVAPSPTVKQVTSKTPKSKDEKIKLIDDELKSLDASAYRTEFEKKQGREDASKEFNDRVIGAIGNKFKEVKENIFPMSKKKELTPKEKVLKLAKEAKAVEYHESYLEQGRAQIKVYEDARAAKKANLKKIQDQNDAKLKAERERQRKIKAALKRKEALQR